MPGCVMSLAVTVLEPAALRVTLNEPEPEESCAPGGSTALGSLEEIATVSLVEIRFQFASAALTVTAKEVPALWGEGAPVFPDAVPGAAVSPGARTWSR